jgi:hypothetical protein
MVQLSPKAAAIKKTVYVPFSVNIYNNAGDAWGIKMSIDDLTTDSMTLNISQRTDNIGYVSYGNEYTIEKQDSNGKWTDVNKAARNNIVFREDYCEFRNDESAKNKAAEDITYYENISFYTGELPVGHYRIKRTFSGNCNGRKGTLNSYAEFDITADTPNSWGLTFGCENDASETGITLYAGVTDPTTAKIFGDIWTGEDYDIERLDNNGEWETLEPVTEDGELYWNSVGIIIPENDTRKISVNWTNTYGKLPKGTYRISKTFMSYANASLEPPAVSRTMYCTFTIDAGGVNIGDYTIDASVTKASVNSLTLAITRSGKYAGTVFWDHGYDIYKKNSSGKFKLFKSTSAINGSTNNTVDLTKNTTVKTTLSVTDVYPELTAGTYRIKLKITDQTGHIKYAAADFVID